MRIRWKFLIVMLSISLIPMITLRYNAQKAMQELGNDLASRSKNELIKETKIALKRLVEDHARILKRERELLEMMLLTLSSEIEKRLADNHVKTASSMDILFPVPEEAGCDLSRHNMYCAMRPSGKCHPLQIDFSRQEIFIPSQPATDHSARDAINRLNSIVTLYYSLKSKYPELILWQYVFLENGLRTIYPDPGFISDRHITQHQKLHDWYSFSTGKKGISWSQSKLEPLTRNMVFYVSVPLHDSKGRFIGATAIAVPLTIFLHENEHIRFLSDNVKLLLVKGDSSSEHPVRIIAQESAPVHRHLHWLATETPSWLQSPDKQKLAEMGDDLQNHRSNVREMEYDSISTLMAYQSFDEYGTALLLIIPREDILKNAILMEKYVHERIHHQIVLTGSILVAIIVLIIALSFFLSRSFTRSLSAMVDAFTQVASGNFRARVQVKSQDELGELGQTFNKMIPELEERVHMKQALDLAAEVQQSLFPRKIPKVPGMNIVARSIYSHETGGDFYDFMDVSRGQTAHIAIAVGDVSGHGLSAALLMATARAFLKFRATQPGTMSQMISDVNRLLAEDTHETSQFVTLFYMEIDPDEKKLYWIRAGHDPAFLFDPESREILQLKGPGLALGVIRDFKFRENEALSCTPGQVILVGTDGIWETRNPEGQMFGKKRVEKIIAESGSKSAEQILNKIIFELENFRNRQIQDDDVTLVVIKVTD